MSTKSFSRVRVAAMTEHGSKPRTVDAKLVLQVGLRRYVASSSWDVGLLQFVFDTKFYSDEQLKL